MKWLIGRLSRRGCGCVLPACAGFAAIGMMQVAAGVLGGWMIKRIKSN